MKDIKLESVGLEDRVGFDCQELFFYFNNNHGYKMIIDVDIDAKILLHKVHTLAKYIENMLLEESK